MLQPTQEALLSCCSSTQWAAGVFRQGPYRSFADLLAAARSVWWKQVPVAAWLEAFAAHPRIGDIEGLHRKFDNFAQHSKAEQSAAAAAPEEVLQELQQRNSEYEDKFGHIFIICASGKSAASMLDAVRLRQGNVPFQELQVAAAEQMKITELRLVKAVQAERQQQPQPQQQVVAERRAGLLLNHVMGGSLRSPITTHVLDTSMGRPAPEVPVALHRECDGSAGAWEQVAGGRTNSDGRIPDLMPPADRMLPGRYRMTFDTTAYMAACKQQHPAFFPAAPFYPTVHVHFQVQPGEQASGHSAASLPLLMISQLRLLLQELQHYHVPLTWNPYGYSTYRGS